MTDHLFYSFIPFMFTRHDTRSSRNTSRYYPTVFVSESVIKGKDSFSIDFPQKFLKTLNPQLVSSFHLPYIYLPRPHPLDPLLDIDPSSGVT